MAKGPKLPKLCKETNRKNQPTDHIEQNQLKNRQIAKKHKTNQREKHG